MLGGATIFSSYVSQGSDTIASHFSHILTSQELKGPCSCHFPITSLTALLINHTVFSAIRTVSLHVFGRENAHKVHSSSSHQLHQKKVSSSWVVGEVKITTLTVPLGKVWNFVSISTMKDLLQTLVLVLFSKGPISRQSMHCTILI